MGSLHFKPYTNLPLYIHIALIVLFSVNVILTVISLRCRQDHPGIRRTRIASSESDPIIHQGTQAKVNNIDVKSSSAATSTGTATCRHGHGWPKNCGRNEHMHYHIPDLFIYRRSRKSGSSSMISSLIPKLEALGYVMLYTNGALGNNTIRNEFGRSNQHHKLAVIEHNAVTRAFHPQRDAVIADTVRDGFSQITSFCRYSMGLDTDCHHHAMQRCLMHNHTLAQLRYRWATRAKEDEDTYIDLPLSPSHSALSTTALRTVFPDLPPLQHTRLHVRDSHCSANDRRNRYLLHLYKRLYAGLDRDIVKLRTRLLILAGYPAQVDERFKSQLPVEKLLDAAEEMELKKLKANGEDVSSEVVETSAGISNRHKLIMSELKRWTIDEDGKIIQVKSKINSY